MQIRELKETVINLDYRIRQEKLNALNYGGRLRG